MNKNAKAVYMFGIAAVVVLVLCFVGRDVLLRRQASLDCNDGPRRTIDIRDFETQYSAYALEIEANVADKARLSAKLTPVQVQQLSEATQSALEFRKSVVAGYNACAISKLQYSQYVSSFQALDNTAREINELISTPSISHAQATKLAGLIEQYGKLVRDLGGK